MEDKTEMVRRFMVSSINGDVESNDEQKERVRLENLYGEVWDTDEVIKVFNITGFLAPFCTAVRKSDNVKGTLAFQHHPRFYFNFLPNS